jgi:hypothetical protein
LVVRRCNSGTESALKTELDIACAAPVRKTIQIRSDEPSSAPMPSCANAAQ